MAASAQTAKLYTFPNNPKAQKILIAARYANVAIEVVCQPPNFVLGETEKSEAFLEKFPFGKVPALVTADGQPLYNSNAIAMFELVFNDPYDQALVAQYLAVAEQELTPPASAWVYPALGLVDSDKAAIAKAKERVFAVFKILDSLLSERTYVVGERISLADIALFTASIQLFQHVMAPDSRAQFPHVSRWFSDCARLPHFEAVVGEVPLCAEEKAL